MTNDELKNVISKWVPEVDFTENNTYLNVTVPADKLIELSKHLKENQNTDFNYLFCVTGMDFGQELGVIYHLESTKYRHIISVTVKVNDRENPKIDSLYNTWPASVLQEMEVYDLFGIKFNGHPNLKRLFLGEEWVGYPLRKDYVDEVNMIIR
jgi:NADH:ubiquinone oxidoreductase subunit C